MTTPSNLWVKDPEDTRWFEFDWSSFLATGETIVTYSVTTGGLTKVDDTSTDTSVLVQVSGGADGDRSVVTCNIHTSNSNIYEAEKSVIIRPRKV